MVVPGNISHREILCDEVLHGKVFTRTNWRTVLLILYIVCMRTNLFYLHTSRTFICIFLQTSVVVKSIHQTGWYYQTLLIFICFIFNNQVKIWQCVEFPGSQKFCPVVRSSHVWIPGEWNGLRWFCIILAWSIPSIT